MKLNYGREPNQKLLNKHQPSNNMIIQKTIRTVLVAGVLGIALAAQGQNPVTFQVDMTAKITDLSFNPATQTVEVRGDTLGWGPGMALTNNTGNTNIYEGTYNFPGGANDLHAAKFWYGNPGDNWESVANRQFVLNGGAQSMPLTAWNVSDWPTPTNRITFQLDMSAQIQLGKFTNSNGYVRVSGGFNGWSGSADFTNNAAATGSGSNVYSQTLEITGFPGSYPGNYKFRAPIGDTWETISDRPSFQVVGGNQTLPLVFWDNASTCDLLQQDTVVTFVLHMTNGTVSTDSHVFDNTVDKLHINGGFLGWWSWYDGIGGANGPANELTNNPVGSEYYQQTFTITKGSPLAQTFKFSVNGWDNEAGFAVNHVRYIRTSGASYVMPVSEFGTNFAATAIEQSFGDLVITRLPNGTNQVSWLGRQCVTLQSKPTIIGGWNDIPATDGMSSTNLPSSGAGQFYRLQKRQGL